MKITIRIDDGLGEKVALMANGNVSGWVRGLIEKAVGNPKDESMQRILRRLDAIEDQLNAQPASATELAIRAARAPAPVPQADYEAQ